MTSSGTENESLIIVDSIDPVNTIIESVQHFLGQNPVAWGRYFTTTYPAEYSHELENNPLHNNNIKLLPIARHTNHVGGSHALGEADAKQGVEDLFSTFSIDYWKSQGSEFFFFLDVEGNPTGPNGSISKEYYTGWSETLISYSRECSENEVTILPCVYANFSDNVTFSILKELGTNLCRGLWIARYYSPPQIRPLWDEDFAVPPIVQKSQIPVFLRQYAGGGQIDEQFDLDQTNPNIKDISTEFLDKLILPPINPSTNNA